MFGVANFPYAATLSLITLIVLNIAVTRSCGWRESALMITAHRHEILRDLLAWAVVLVFMFPLAWWVLASFKPYTAIFNTTPVYADFAPTTTNYEVTLLGRSRVEAETGVGGTAGGGSSYYSIPSILDSVIVAVGSTALALTLSTLAAYGLSRFRFHGQQQNVFWVLAQRMMPPIAVAIPIFFMFRDLGLRDTHLGLILAHTLINLPIAVLLMKSFLDDIRTSSTRRR